MEYRYIKICTTVKVKSNIGTSKLQVYSQLINYWILLLGISLFRQNIITNFDFQYYINNARDRKKGYIFLILKIA